MDLDTDYDMSHRSKSSAKHAHGDAVCSGIPCGKMLIMDARSWNQAVDAPFAVPLATPLSDSMLQPSTADRWVPRWGKDERHGYLFPAWRSMSSATSSGLSSGR